MKEIKFRAWNHKEKMMGYNLDLQWNSETNCWSFISRSDFYVGRERFNGTECSCTIMQYTGLKDKNDKEIYEGDIINFNNSPTEIRYCVSDGCWIFDNLVPGQCGQEIFDEEIAGSYEVIGNIYENGELLESKCVR